MITELTWKTFVVAVIFGIASAIGYFLTDYIKSKVKEKL